jgi:hypothetical protein
MHAKLASYDEDGNRVWEADGESLTDLVLLHSPLYPEHRHRFHHRSFVRLVVEPSLRRSELRTQYCIYDNV